MTERKFSSVTIESTQAETLCAFMVTLEKRGKDMKLRWTVKLFRGTIMIDRFTTEKATEEALKEAIIKGGGKGRIITVEKNEEAGTGIMEVR